jgi:hypothetical protein
MDVSPVLVPDLQASEAVEPGERPFDHPAVASQAVLKAPRTKNEPKTRANQEPSRTSAVAAYSRLSLREPYGRAFSGEPSEQRERPERMRGRRVRCNAMLGDR